MSTRIYTGFRFLTDSFSEIHQHIMVWRAEVQASHKTKLAERMAKMAVDYLDLLTCFPEEARGELQDPLFHAFKQMTSFNTAMKERGRNEYGFEVFLYPFEGHVYGTVCSSQQEWTEAWMAKPFLEEFGFWNNTDELEGVSEEDWRERGRIWEGIFAADPMAVPSTSGFGATCTRESEFVGLDEVMQHLPSLDERLTSLARHAAKVAYQEVLLDQNCDPGARNRRTSAWLETPSGHAVIAEERKRLEGLIRNPIMRSDLIEKAVIVKPDANQLSH